MYKFKNVVVAISGGVDSAVAALLLKRRGYNLQGVFMQNWDITDEQGFCSASEDYRDAQLVCNKLKIPLIRVNFVKEYWHEVFTHIKFGNFYKYAKEKLKADAIATGHYAMTSFGPFLENFRPATGVKLLQAADTTKDQTFFLCQIQQIALRETMFPLGTLTKPEVKQIAIRNDLKQIAVKKESMGICFIGSRNFQNFISEYVRHKPGKFIDIDTGSVVGQHNGIHQWTLGQRSRIGGAADTYYIAEKDVATSTIYVAMGTDHPALHSKLFFTSLPHWIHGNPIELDRNEIYTCQFKFQHTHDLEECELCQTPRGLIVRLFKSKKALTPGQYAVFYNGNECLGSARIVHPGPSEFLMCYLQNKSFAKKQTTKKAKVGRRLNKPIKGNAIRENELNLICL